MSTKICLRCDIEKDVKEFHFTNKSKGYRVSYCKDCERLRLREYMAGNWTNEPRKNRVKKLGGACECCGETEPSFLHIHHETPTDLKVLCANCHNAIHRIGYCPHQKYWTSI